MERNKSKNGMTLIALIITIIVMLILVAVSVQIVINSGLFDSAKTAAKKTEVAYRAEATEGDKVNIDGEIYNSMEEYIQNSCTHEWEEEIIKEATCKELGSKKIKCTKCGKERMADIPIDLKAHKFEGETCSICGATCTVAGTKQKICNICKHIEAGSIEALGHSYTNYVCTRCGAEDPNKPIEVATYIKYDVEYTDAYISRYNYTATNGWRLLHATPNGDGTYRDVELISTGIPAKFYYHVNNTGTWWETSKLTEFKNLLGGSSYNFYKSGAACQSLKAAAGFYYNFGSLPFAQSTSDPSVNNGTYTAITNSDQKSGTTAGTGAALFLTGKASGVRLLTLKELNEARGIKNDPDNLENITAAQDSTGLYRLDQLKSVTGIGTTSYTTGYYWLASPYAGNNGAVVGVNYKGGVDGSSGNTRGLRPVVKISRI